MFKYKLAKSKGMHFATNGTTNSKKAVGELTPVHGIKVTINEACKILFLNMLYEF